jgi:hypothetical protein
MILATAWTRTLTGFAIPAALVVGLGSAQPRAAEEFHYDASNVGTAVYFAALSNLANAVMFSGFGEALVISPYERDEWLRRAGFVARPAMPDMAAVGALYAAAQPKFASAPDFAAPCTLTWDQSSFDRTLDPGAQAWAMVKISSPEFHLQFHDLPDNKLTGLMMIPQARAQAQTLEKRLLNEDGLFAPRGPDGAFGEARARDQIAVLWAASNLILAATSPRDDYWHTAWRDLTDPDSHRTLMHKAFTAVGKLPPQTAAERGLAIEALGRFALAAGEDAAPVEALDLVRAHAERLEDDPGTTIEDIALAVYGLTEAGRLLEDASFAASAAALFEDRLLPLWDEAAGLFRNGDGPVVNTPRTVGAAVAALNAMRWHGAKDAATRADALFPRFFESAIVRSGLLQASPLPLVAEPYVQEEPAEHFAHPALPDAAATGTAPVLAAEVTFDAGGWTVTDTTFRTSDALFLANMLAMRSDDGRTDLFLPDGRLGALE